MNWIVVAFLGCPNPYYQYYSVVGRNEIILHDLRNGDMMEIDVSQYSDFFAFDNGNVKIIERKQVLPDFFCKIKFKPGQPWNIIDFDYLPENL